MRILCVAAAVAALAAAGCQREYPESRKFRENAEAGNAAMKKADYREAVRRYDEAIKYHLQCEKYDRSDNPEIGAYRQAHCRLLTSKAQAHALLGQMDEADRAARGAQVYGVPDAPPIAHYIIGVAAATKGDEATFNAKIKYLSEKDFDLAMKLQKVGDAALKAAKGGKSRIVPPLAPLPAPAPAPKSGPAPG